LIYAIAENQPSLLWFDLAGALRENGQQLNTADNFHVGLRSIAFHPDFENNGKFYVSAMLDRPVNTNGLTYLSDVAEPIEADGVLIEWEADPETMAVNWNSYREVFRVGMPVYDHTIKQIQFGPDGLLYIAHGDGSVKSATTGGGQRLDDALGKILRVNPLQSGDAPFSIPADNPFVGNPAALPEIYSLGHRNPHHIAFTPSGQLIVADSGRDNLDEINLVEKGGDHGWSAREGTYVHLQGGGLLDGIAILPEDDAANGYVYPAIQFGHTGPRGANFVGQALGGGYVVNNNSPLQGKYFYCEFATLGEVYFADVTEMEGTVRQGAPSDLTQAQIHRAKIMFDHDGNPGTASVSRQSMTDVVNDSPNYDGSGRADIRFGQGPDGTLYIMSKRNGTIYRIANSRPE
ncbi:MAG: PQQ-dependent sugar dehydrogenase, partial [Burkholderiaceae bacterium]